MKKSWLILPLLACALMGCKDKDKGGDNNNAGGNGGGGDPVVPVTHDGLSIETAFTAQEAVNMMKQAGSGVIVQNKEFYVSGTFDAGTTVQAQYHQFYGNVACGADSFKVSGATLASGITANEVDGALDGKSFVVYGYMELYNSEYKVGYLPASASPTGSKYVPTIVKLDGQTGTIGGGGTSGGGEGPGGGGGSQGSLSGLTSFVKVDFAGTTAKEGTGEHGRLSADELKTLVTSNASVSGKVTNATGENVYQGYVPGSGDTSAYKAGVSGALRMGGSSKTGTLVLTVGESAKGVRISAHAWEAKEKWTDSVSVNGAAAVKMTLDYANYEFSFNGTTTITITTTNRAFIQSIELFK